MWEGVLVGLVVGAFIGRTSLRFRKPMLVEEFKIEPYQKDGFTRLLVKLSDESHRIEKYEFHPAHAHGFSDELLRHAARAMAPKPQPGE